MPGMNEEKEVTNVPVGSEGGKVRGKHHGESHLGQERMVVQSLDLTL